MIRKLRVDFRKKEERKLDCLQEKGVGTWLSAIPSYSCSTALSLQELRDELRDRCCLPLLRTPSRCNGCNAKFSVSHSLACKVSGLIRSRHDESRHSLICLASAGFLLSSTHNEPSINPCCDNSRDRELRDLATGLAAELSGERGGILI